MEPDFDKAKLIPAIVQDIVTKDILMLAYVNEESYKFMQTKKETCFYSRSRQKLWHKGGMSGNIQKIKKMYIDCDCDTLLIMVEQTGVACHTGQRSCFYREISDFNLDSIKGGEILNDLYNMIEEREKKPKYGSYTNYLLNQGIDKICKKVAEETAETIIAAKNSEKGELIAEISDLVYHLIILMYVKKVRLEDIRRELCNRHKIESNKKKINKKGEY